MSSFHFAHNVNIAIHILIGIVGIILGCIMLFAPKGDALHRQRGWYFIVMIGGVIVTAMIGLTIFRYMPVFAVLTVVVAYQALSGWRAVKRQALGPNWVDVTTTLVAAALLVVAGYTMFNDVARNSIALNVAALSGGVVLIFYDLVRFLFPRRWRATIWQYEHIYKMIATISAMVSAGMGNVFRAWQPWTQILPSLFFLGVIAYVFWQMSRNKQTAVV